MGETHSHSQNMTSQMRTVPIWIAGRELEGRLKTHSAIDNRPTYLELRMLEKTHWNGVMKRL